MIAGWMEYFFIIPDLKLLFQYIVKKIVFTGENAGYRYYRMHATIVKTFIMKTFIMQKNNQKMIDLN